MSVENLDENESVSAGMTREHWSQEAHEDKNESANVQGNRPDDKVVTKQPVAVLELFCGIGGMRFALSYAGLDVDTTRSLAVDINTEALDIYRWNFAHKEESKDVDVAATPTSGGVPSTSRRKKSRIKHGSDQIAPHRYRYKGMYGIANVDLSTAPLDMFSGYDIWTMSPPCQPFSRQGNQKGLEDERSSAFARILCALEELPTADLPSMLLLENVKNFEISLAYRKLVDVLDARGFIVSNYLLSPNQFGFPNSRLRFFLVAELLSREERARQRKSDIEGTNSNADCAAEQEFPPPENLRFEIPDVSIEPPDIAGIDVYSLDFSRPSTHCPHGIAFTPGMLSIKDFLLPWLCEQAVVTREETEEKRAICRETFSTPWLVPDSVLSKRASVTLDLVYPQCQHSMCVTKAYGRFYNGTGSVLVTDETFGPESQNGTNLDEPGNMLQWSSRIRFFHPLETFSLMGFKLAAGVFADSEDDAFQAERILERRRKTAACDGSCLPLAASADKNAHERFRCRCRYFSLPDSTSKKTAWSCAGNSLNPQVVSYLLHYHLRGSAQNRILNGATNNEGECEIDPVL